MIINDIKSLKKKFPFTIIGTGPASLTVALELDEKKIPCLILEASGFKPSDKSQNFYRGYSGGQGSYLNELHISRLRYFGGTTGHWSGLSKPLDEYDFKNWPIKKKDLDKYLDKASSMLELESKFNSDITINNNIKQSEYEYSNQKTYNKNHKPVRFGDKYKERVIKSKYIYLATFSPVLEIIGNEKNTTHLLVKNSNTNEDLLLSVNNVIVGCGGYENARLLLWSQKNSKKNFLKDLKIGTHFNVHPGWPIARAIARIDKLENILLNKLKSPMWSGTYILSPTQKFINEKKIGNISIRISKYNHRNAYKEILREILCVAPEYGKKIAKLANKKIYCTHMKLWAAAEQEPIEENRVTLSDTDFDEYGIPRINMNFRLQNSVRDTMRIFAEEVGKFFISEDLGRLKIENWLYDYTKNFSIHGKADNGSHHIGSTRMGDSYKNSVVDKNLKVHNINNLYVVGSSVFSKGGAVNPTLSITQLSIRLSDHLKSKI
jgi:choline dehydrogenase-like flavoprotein